MNCPNCSFALAPNAAGYISCSKCGYQNNQVTGQVVAASVGSAVKTFDQAFSVRKSRWVAVVLACCLIFFGLGGLHNLYLGMKTRGIIQMAASGIIYVICFSSGVLISTGIGAFVGIPLLVLTIIFLYFPLLIWQVVEMFQILNGKVKQDAYGNPIV